MANILILIGSHLCQAPRPQKEAEALAQAGHRVTVRGFWFEAELAERDRALMRGTSWSFEPILDFRSSTLSAFSGLRSRLEGRWAREKLRWFGRFSPALLGTGAEAMLEVARHEHADLTIVHSEAGLWVGAKLLRDKACVGVDFEDWFSEDLLAEDRVLRPISEIRECERVLARGCSYRLVTSSAMADALAQAYETQKLSVVYNVFPWAERARMDGAAKDRTARSRRSVHWFSQTIGPGRGLELLFRALPFIRIPIEIHLRGNLPERLIGWLSASLPEGWKDRVFVHPTVPNRELLSRIAEHDMGLALERCDIPSRNLTITNKIFQYMQAGLAVIATDTLGQKEVFAQRPEVGRMVPWDNAEKLAEAITDLGSRRDQMEKAKQASLAAAREFFCWEKQAERIVQAAADALAARKTYAHFING